MILRFAEILPREYARGSGRRFVVGHSLRATALVECVGGKRCAAETEVRKRPSDSLHGQTSPLSRLRRHRRDTAASAADY